MDIKVALSIFNQPWLIERNAALSCLDIFHSLKEGQKFQYGDPTTRQSKLIAAAGISVAPTDTWAAEEHAGYEGVETVILPITGPLMKSNFCGGFGTASLLNEFRKAEKTASVRSIILMIDSPGGSVDGTEAFANAIKGSSKTTMAVIDGVCASGGYWLASSADEVWATGETNLIGSIGTYMSWYDRTEALRSNGIILREFYATASTQKNKIFRDANAGDGKALIEEFLDPTNNIFLNHVKTQRAGKLDQAQPPFDGKLYHAAEAKKVGLIEGITTMDKAIARSRTIAQNKNSIRMSNAIKYAQLCILLSWADGFEATSEGVHLQEEHLGLINQALIDAQANTARLEEELATARAELETQTETATSAAKKVTELEAKILILNDQDAADPKTPVTTADDKIDTGKPANEFETSADREIREQFAR